MRRAAYGGVEAVEKPNKKVKSAGQNGCASQYAKFHSQRSQSIRNGGANYLDQLQPGTFEHAIHHLIEHRLDLSVFFPAYQNDITGRYAYDPKILLKIVLFAYSKGITSSREIQWNCQNNITFMALACGEVPHFTTIAANGVATVDSKH